MFKKAALFLIRFYQLCVRWLLPPACRFIPSCSEYTKEAIIKYGFLKGTYKGAKRISSCHYLSGKSGYDPLD